MIEIKIVQNEVESTLSEIKSKAEEFNTSNLEISFPESHLALLDEISSIEQKYYRLIEQYKNLLLRTEQDMRTAIEQMVQKDKELSQQMK
jgi:hypothetical protein